MDKPAKQKHNTSADTPNQLLSASHTIELLARISAVLLADPLSERTRGRQKVLALCTAASAFIAISGARMDELSLFGMTFEEVNKQMLTYSLAATCLMLLVIFLLSDYFDFAAARYTTLSATMEVTAALNTLQSYLDWEEPERLEFERQRTLFSMNAYVDMRKRHVMGEQVQALSKAKDLEIKRLHEQFGSNVYDGIDIDALHSSDVSVSTTERNKLIQKSMPSFYPLAEQRGGNVQERIRILTEENEQSEKFLKNQQEIAARYDALIDPIVQDLESTPAPNPDEMYRLGTDRTDSAIGHWHNLALLNSATASSRRIKILTTIIECGAFSVATAIVIVNLVW